MSDHKTFLSALSPAERTALLQQDTRGALLHFALHLGLILACGSYIAWGLPYWGLLLVPQGILLVFLFCLSHECTHATPFGPTWLNALVGHLVAPLLALPFVWFRYFHLAHHKHTNDPAQDPELLGEGRPDTWESYVLYLSGWTYWRSAVRTLFAHAQGDVDAPYLPEGKHKAMIIEAQVILALYALCLFALPFLPILFWVWILPVLLGQPVLRFVLLAEHGLCPFVSNMLENSRTTRSVRFMRWLAWNMPYHAEHHVYPSVPFQNLPVLHAYLKPHLKTTSDGYAAFHKGFARTLK